MLISRQWLLSMLAVGDDPDAAELAATLTGLGLEVEAVRAVGQGLEAIVVGEVVSKRPHPQADKLTLVELTTGAATLPIVCGAPNVPEPGGKVAFAPVGATLPGGMRIEARAIRGERSEGMICSETELDIGPDGDGIVVLPTGFATGAKLADLVPGAIDDVLELSITPNRPDALGHVGIARDLAVKLRRPLALPPVHAPVAPVARELVTIEAKDGCTRYLGHAFEDASIGRSPPWLRVRLHRLGLRPISDVVDVTNLVLLEHGQPLHAFDRAKLRGARVVVRRARTGETLQTLDGRVLELRQSDLVIADAERPQALAGVMGGTESGVDASTRELLLEAAHFAPVGIRRTARAHQIATDSSYRFERGVDHGANLERAYARAATLIAELTGARAVASADVRGETPPTPDIPLRPERVRLVLGMDVPVEDAQRILRGLEIDADASDPARWRCRPPTHRPDLVREVDLIEEIVRHHGFDALPTAAAMPTAPNAPGDADAARALELHAATADALRSAGLHETITFVFADPDSLAPFSRETPPSRSVRLENPMRMQASMLRTHVLPGLLDALATNLARHGRPVRLFELGRVYDTGKAGRARPRYAAQTEVLDRVLVHECTRSGVLLGGSASGPLQTQRTDAREVGAILLGVLRRLGHAAQVRPLVSGQKRGWLHPGVQASIEVALLDGTRRTVGVFGEVHPDLLAARGIADAHAVYGELWLDELPPIAPQRLVAIPRFPATSRDLSLDVRVDVPAIVVVDAVRDAARDSERGMAESDPPRLDRGDRGDAPIELLEDFRGAGIESGRRALLLRLHYRARGRSVTDVEVQALHESIVAGACATLSALDPTVRPR